jgi:hypothetical protein
MLQDVVAIRKQAYEVGNELSFRLALLVTEGVIPKNQPLHLIGHSAGGFVVARAAINLVKMNLAPSPMRVTILDTPAPDDELLVTLPAKCPTDFYVSSAVGGAIPPFLNLADFSAANMHMKKLVAPADLSWLDAHRWAYKWFIRTIAEPACDDCQGEGFNRSPILKSTVAR